MTALLSETELRTIAARYYGLVRSPYCGSAVYHQHYIEAQGYCPACRKKAALLGAENHA